MINFNTISEGSPIVRLEDDKQIRIILSTWMRSVLEEQGFSKSEWSFRADVPRSIITKFLKHSDAPIPNVKTIFKLANVAGSMPALFTNPAGNPFPAVNKVREISVYRPSDVLHYVFHKTYNGAFQATDLHAVGTIGATGNDISMTAWAVTVTTNAMDLEGIQINDVAFVDTDAEIGDNDLVAVAHKDSKTLNVCRFKPPFAICSSSEKTQPFELNDCILLGRVLRISRDIA